MAEWKPGEAMSKDFALLALKEIKGFYRRLFFIDDQKPFNGEEDFEGALSVIDGLIGYVEATEVTPFRPSGTFPGGDSKGERGGDV
ncbi:MAG: hypothetical protein IJH37_05145 [Clostridia bacterium]|nr:hypothetical protein [Clostridia bacterium]